MNDLLTPDLAKRRVPATIVNHVAIDIAASRDQVWQDIVEQYAEARKFSNDGFEILPFDDLTAPFGGYRMILVQDGTEEDVRDIRITELDPAAGRLSIHADYLSVSGGMEVYVTYGSQEIAGGTRYTLDCHSRLAIEIPTDGTREDVAATARQTTASFQEGLTDYLNEVRKRLEAGQ